MRPACRKVGMVVCSAWLVASSKGGDNQSEKHTVGMMRKTSRFESVALMTWRCTVRKLSIPNTCKANNGEGARGRASEWVLSLIHI